MATFMRIKHRAGTADENECAYCVECQGDTVGGCGDDQVDPVNTTQCL